MCGIVGLLFKDPERPCSPETVLAMRDVAAYRGPDDAGLYISGPVGLGHRRLSIIDLGGGHQPMADATDTSWVVFNGEIYNFRSARSDLTERGHVFRTDSDTEVILHLYAEYGERCVEKMNGMFSFAVWDSVKRSLFLARDRMGVKPLYYVDTPEAFAFASEVKSLFKSGLVSARCREAAVAEYMLFRQVAGDESLFYGVRTLPPGCTMTVTQSRTEIIRYWSPRPAAAPVDLSHDEALATLSHLLEDSVRLRLVSDVPVGTFCSGGVDSSLVTALAARLKGDGINTYSIGFDDPDFDESAQALQVSQHCHTSHHQLKVGNGEFSELLPQLIWHNDEPLDFANSVQIFALSRLAKQSVKVVLTGEGSDELFGGYPRYRIPQLASYFRYLPAPLRRLLVTATGDHRLAKLERAATRVGDDLIQFNASYNTLQDVVALCPAVAPYGSAHRRGCVEAGRQLGLDLPGRTSLNDQETFLVGILLRQDKMSMAASIESRVPFMDYRVVEFANRLPTSLKMNRTSGKTLVKDFARTMLPADIVDRRKSGFGVPLARWFRANDGLGARLGDLPGSPAADVFDRLALTRLVAEHKSGQHDHSELLWTAMNFVMWREVFHC